MTKRLRCPYYIELTANECKRWPIKVLRLDGNIEIETVL